MIKKEDLQRFSLYTFLLGWIVFFFQKKLPYVFTELSKSLIFYVVICVYYIYIVYGFSSVFSFYKRIAPWIHSPYIVLLLDIGMHTLPLLLVGLPKHLPSMFTAYLILIAWYILVYKDIPHLYMPSLSMNEYNFLLLFILPLTIFIYSISLYTLNPRSLYLSTRPSVRSV